jgi:hypothetical protein
MNILINALTSDELTSIYRYYLSLQLMKDQDYIRALHEVMMTVFAWLSRLGKKGW